MTNFNFAGILSRKQEIKRENNAQQSTVANQTEVAVVVDPRDIIRDAARARATSRKQKEADQMRQEAQDMTPQPAASKQSETPKQPAAPMQVQSTAALRSRTRKTAFKQEAAPKQPAAAKQEAAPRRAEASKQAAVPNQEAARPRFTLIQYSDKCVALFGDTKPIKDELRKIGGRYNPNLHPFGPDTSVPGWVFPNKHRDDVQRLITNH